MNRYYCLKESPTGKREISMHQSEKEAINKAKQIIVDPGEALNVERTGRCAGKRQNGTG